MPRLRSAVVTAALAVAALTGAAAAPAAAAHPEVESPLTEVLAPWIGILEALHEQATQPPVPVTSPEGVTTVDGVLLVNKTWALPDWYAPGDLTPETRAAFEAMAADAAAAGLRLEIVSGYREYSYQVGLYRTYVERHGTQAADTFSARPGHSEHQSGLAFDVNSTKASFAGTPEAQWIAANAHRFGLIVRYPEGKEAATGYIYEPWHLRYVGVDLATTLVTEGATLEEHFGLTSAY